MLRVVMMKVKIKPVVGADIAGQSVIQVIFVRAENIQHHHDVVDR